MSSFKITQAKLKDIGTVVSAKTIKRRLSQEFGLKSSKPTLKPHLTRAMKGKRLDFAKKNASLDVDMWKKITFFSRVFCTAVFCSKISSLEVYWITLGGKVPYPYCETLPSQIIWGAMPSMGTAELYFQPPETTMNGENM